MAFCSQCGADVTGVGFCAKCGAPVEGASGGGTASAASPSSGGSTIAAGSQDNLMGALAYLTFLPAVVFLVMEPYNKNRFIRFHSFQSIFFNLAALVVWVAFGIIGGVLSVVGIGILILLFNLLVWIGLVGVWVILVVKAYQGQEFKLPVIGDLAAKQAG